MGYEVILYWTRDDDASLAEQLCAKRPKPEERRSCNITQGVPWRGRFTRVSVLRDGSTTRQGLPFSRRSLAPHRKD
jgi:hypothetical protein